MYIDEKIIVADDLGLKLIHNYPSIYTLKVPNKISLWRELVGEKMKIIIFIE
ncbi:MAG: hypothetical protein PWQ96_36 [Clostridia bacterium]|jgi:hypothetical protein|nr:hypothetical protein [Clostridiales bacterium]MDK2984394.1 hypothetical protein [Clostridia bacterium]